jgi:hypothetical protein
MDLDKDMMLAIVGERASRTAAELSRELLTAPAEELEAIRAGIELEVWLAQSCRACCGSR